MLKVIYRKYTADESKILMAESPLNNLPVISKC